MTRKTYKKEWYLKNRERLLNKRKKYYLTHKKQAREYHRKNTIKIHCRQKKYREMNKLKLKKAYRNWCQTHKKERNEMLRIKRKKDINFKILDNLRSRIFDALKNNTKSARTLELIGCSIKFLKKYLKSRFVKGMSWKNYGKWHIDHIIPCAKFDLSKVSEQRKCFHYTNLQPLWAFDNMSKGVKF